MKVVHTCIAQNWNRDEDLIRILNNAEILVLGSFNPHNPYGKNADFYYGRKENYFWKSISILEGKAEDYYYNDFSKKKLAMEKFKFICFDVIDEIEVCSSPENENIISDFINEKIFKGFFDSDLFTTKSDKHYPSNSIFINRKYNNKIFEVLMSKKLKKVIHTMGNNRIDNNFNANPKEKKLGDIGFQGYLKRLRTMCNDIDFVRTSFSPSAIAVRKGGQEYLPKLQNWINHHLLIEQREKDELNIYNGSKS